MIRRRVECDLCGSSEGILEDHYEDHLRVRINVGRRCHADLHVAIYFHAYDTLWRDGFGDEEKETITKNFTRRYSREGSSSAMNAKEPYEPIIVLHFPGRVLRGEVARSQGLARVEESSRALVKSSELVALHVPASEKALLPK